MKTLPIVTYETLPENELWWCNSHQRICTHVQFKDGQRDHVCCTPGLGGIMIQCFAVDITGIANLEIAEREGPMKTYPTIATKTEQVQIPEYEAKKLAAQLIRQACNIHEESHIDADGNLVHWERSSGSVDTVVDRPATHLDRAALLVLREVSLIGSL